MSNALDVTDSDFETQIEQHKGLAVVDFWAAWCGPCRMIAPILDQLATEYTGKAKVAKVDVDANQQTAMRFNVRSIRRISITSLPMPIIMAPKRASAPPWSAVCFCAGADGHRLPPVPRNMPVLPRRHLG